VELSYGDTKVLLAGVWRTVEGAGLKHGAGAEGPGGQLSESASSAIAGAHRPRHAKERAVESGAC
jgi:hypothetical protein